MTEKEKYINEINRLKAENRDLRKKITQEYIAEYKDITDYGAIYDKLDTFVFLTDKDTFEIIYANQKTKSKYGNIEGKKCWEVFENKIEGPCDFCDYAKRKDDFGKKFNDLNREFFNKDENKWFLIHDVLVDIKNLGLKRLSIAYDIDRQKRLQLENTERTQNIRHIFNNVSEAIFVVRENKFKFINKATENFFGLNSDKLLDKPVQDFLLSPFKEKFFSTITKILNSEIKQKRFYLKIIDAVGNLRDVRINTEIITWKGERSILVVMQDITIERQVRKKLKESEKFYKILFEYSPMPVLIYSEGKIVLFNNALKKYIKEAEFNYVEKVLLEELVHPDSKEKVNKAVKKIENGTDFILIDNIKVFNFKKDTLNVSLVISAILYKSKPAYIVIINDITDRIKAEEELKKTISVKDKFFSIIAHDLRNPFNQIMGFSELLKEDIANNDLNRIKRLTEYIYLSAENGYKLLENLLHWAKSQTGSVAFCPENINLTEVISEAISFYKINAERKNINLTFKKNSDNDCVFFDKEMLKTILRNLLSNALKYTSKGGYVEITVYEKKDCFQINVSDTGTGIPEEQKNKIFDESEMFTTAGTDNEKGSGLGLAVCKEFVEKNNGKIFLETEYGKGSTFSFTAKKCL